METKKIIEALGSMTAVELNELSKAIKEHFQLADIQFAAGGGSAADTSEAASGAVDVKIVSVGGTKMQVVKCIQAFTEKSLKEANDYVGDEKRVTVGKFVGKKLEKADADKLKADLETAGATVELVSA